MRKHRVALVSIAALLLIACGITWFLTGLKVDTDKLTQYCQGYEPGQGVTAVPAASTNNTTATPEQRTIANKIIAIGRKRGISYRGIVLALMVAKQESGIRNIPYGEGDLDSVGVFQQRPSQGWGTVEQILDVDYATNKFYDALEAVAGWQSMSYLDAALAVQRPSRAAYLSSSNYFPGWEDFAKNLVAKYDPSLVTVDGDVSYTSSQAIEYVCERVIATFGSDASQMDQIMTAALSRVGDPYEWNKPSDGASFVAWAFGQASLDIPTSLDEQMEYEGDEAAGIKTDWYPAEDILSGKVALERGDQLYWGTGTDPPSAATTGLFAGNTDNVIRVASYNVLGSSHTTGVGSWSGVERVEDAFSLMTRKGFTVVGLQELQRDQRKRLVKLMGQGWGIWPDKPTFTDRGGAVHANNSIIWDKSQVQLVSGSKLNMPRYFRGPRDIPLVQLEHLASGQKFWVANTHDPTKAYNAKQRMLNAEQHAADSDRLVSQGKTVFFTGDFNSGYDLRTGNRRGNKTYQDWRPNLTWCIMTRSGTMLNGYDASRTPPRTGFCPQQTTRELGIGTVDHVYASRDVQVSNYEIIRGRGNTYSDHPVVFIDASTDIMRHAAKPGKLGTYVGPNPKTGTISLLKVRPENLLGVMRYTFVTPTVSTSDGWTLPVAKPYRLTNYFGQPEDYYASGFHTGQDFAWFLGTPVFAATSGEIVDAGWAGAYGNRVVIRLPDGSELLYAHLNQFAERGGAVKTGQVIGFIGQTGNAFGPHLHFEVRLPNGTLIDPIPVLRSHGLDP